MEESIEKFYTVAQFVKRYPAFTEASVRWLIYKSRPRMGRNGSEPGNGFDVALRQVGRRVLISESGFLLWMTGVCARDAVHRVSQGVKRVGEQLLAVK